MISFLHSASVQGIDACLIDVEIDISSGLPVFSIVGLPDTSVKESRDRVVSAIKNRMDFLSIRFCYLLLLLLFYIRSTMRTFCCFYANC